ILYNTINSNMSDIKINENFINMPVIPLRGIVVFPEMVLHFDVGRKKSVAALKYAMKESNKVFLVSQRDASVEDPDIGDIYSIGVICSIKQLIKIPNSDNLRVVVEGEKRGKIFSFSQTHPYITGEVSFIDEENVESDDKERAYCWALKSEFEKYSAFVPKISNDVKIKVNSLTNSGKLCDYICTNCFFDFKDKQNILETITSSERIFKLLVLLNKENSTLATENEIHEKVQDSIDKNQREYYLREEMRVIGEVLGDNENPLEEADEFKDKIEKLSCGAEIKEKLLKEAGKLIKMPQGSHEATVIRNYLDKCLELPFGKYTKDNINLNRARKILDKEHYSLEKIKERIIESLAVFKRNPDFSGQILCLAGPPGVGKTSIVKSLAKSMNRKYVRIALGGIQDESEIRGHRRTYIGAMPGRIIDAIIKSGSINPVILLDEIDKIGNDYKGDPSSALLEALDPEQNFSFFDHYIDFPVDLSKVLFVTTANDAAAIPKPLLDRMEIIELNSYTADEKFHIAKDYLVKKEIKKHNISGKEFKITDDALFSIIESYTSEAGVRGL
ncbi:MAG: LON peptidase substrate-binding domain-containing protein, partial [Clostridiales bacterium]|nr:LON peptidase substrate-binding domain-containing protein [Clostridiales bacterium]